MDKFISLLSPTLFTAFAFLFCQFEKAYSSDKMSSSTDVVRNIDCDLMKNNPVRTIITNLDTAYDRGDLKDVDGNSYAIIKIGNQQWIARNLKVTRYNDGTSIDYVTDDTTWSFLSTGAYCWYNNDKATYKNTYGALYNWHTVNTGKLCPTGWHVPTDAEWSTLTTSLGGESVADGKLKETGTTHWHSSNTGATNESGFTALPGGNRCNCGAFDIIGYNGTWWSSTEYDTYSAYTVSMYDGYSFISRSNNHKSYGFSVRCVRD